MNEFSVGDRVRVLSEIFPEQNGLTGVVIAVNPDQRLLNLPIRVRYDDNQKHHKYLSNSTSRETNAYNANDLILIEHPTVMDDTRDYLEAIT